MTCPEPLRAPDRSRGCLLGLVLCFLSAVLSAVLVVAVLWWAL